MLFYLKTKSWNDLWQKTKKKNENREGYAKGEHEFNASQIVESEEDDNDDPEDYDSCTDDQFTCKNSDCISVDKRCDGTRHCHDGSDELNCAFNKTGD